MAAKIDTLKAAIEALGWSNYYSCNCPSGKKHYFSKATAPGYKLRSRPAKGTFVIIKDNITIAGPFYEYDLEVKLKEHALS